MTVKRPEDLQLRFELNLDEVQGDAVERAISPEQARLISEAARAALHTRLDGEEHPAWMEDYLELLRQGWPWRIACYIAWAASPKQSRKPKTLDELATRVLGLTSPRVIYEWRKDGQLDTTIGMMQGAVLWEHRRDVLEALAKVASEPDYKAHNDRQLFLEMTGDYIPHANLGLSDPAGGPLLPVAALVEALRQAGQALEPDENGDDVPTSEDEAGA